MTKSAQNDRFETHAKTKPWYCYAIVWMVFMLPASVVVASMITIAIAYKHAPVLLGSEPAGGKVIEQTEDVTTNTGDSASISPH